MRLAVALFMIVLPSRLRAEVGRRLFGWEIDPTAYLGRSIVVVRHLSLGPGANIGHLNVIWDLDELRLGEGSSVSTRNWITGSPKTSDHIGGSADRYSSLVMGCGAMITMGHNIDCSDRVIIGDHAGIVGFGCTVLTRQLDLAEDKAVTAPVEVADRAVVMSGCTMLSGSRVPTRSIVSAGSVITTPLTEELSLYRGNPAEAVRSLPANLRLWRRELPKAAAVGGDIGI